MNDRTTAAPAAVVFMNKLNDTNNKRVPFENGTRRFLFGYRGMIFQKVFDATV